MAIALVYVIFALFVETAFAIPIDNGVEGEPEIECGPASIAVAFVTQNAFHGHVYVKGYFDQPVCRNDEGGRQIAGIALPFDNCNVARTRSLNPKGVFVSATIIISFHPKFTTKVDRAYRIRCFYMEADKTVSSELEVSMLTTGLQTQVVPMPVCRYEVLTGGPTGQPIKFALIGDQVYHKWSCDSETVDTFCMLVHSCYVDDGNGDKVDLLNAEGCALDKFILNNLEYPTDLMAGQEAHVFKYADRTQLYFQCQIGISIKEPNGQCTRPSCPEPNGISGLRRRRDVDPNRDNIGILDVRAEVSAYDVDAESDSLALQSAARQRNAHSRVPYKQARAEERVCLTTAGLVTLIGLAAVLLLAAIVVAAHLVDRSPKV
uniref:ZP domain-containing protein n=1 Tax=Plectus sambesii TaxID=2011161 RepID=A0A914UIN8_9BILA